jgi:hypothetical protein
VCDKALEKQVAAVIVGGYQVSGGPGSHEVRCSFRDVPLQLALLRAHAWRAGRTHLKLSRV